MHLNRMGGDVSKFYFKCPVCFGFAMSLWTGASMSPWRKFDCASCGARLKVARSWISVLLADIFFWIGAFVALYLSIKISLPFIWAIVVLNFAVLFFSIVGFLLSLPMVKVKAV